MNEKEIIADLKKTIEYAQKCCREDAYINQETLFEVLNLLEKKDKIIDLMAEELVKAHGWFYSEFDNFTEKNWIDYFTKKVEGK